MFDVAIFYRFKPASVSKAFITLLLGVVLLSFLAPVWAGKVAPASGHHLMVDKKKKLWGWGDNSYGQLGIEGLSATKLRRQINMASPVLMASAGQWHSVALDNRGSVWVWGDNSEGQLGTGDFKSLRKPSRLELPSVVAVAAGAWHTVALDKSGHVWAWGGNTLGQLGGGKSSKFSVSTTPQKVEGLDNVIAISTGDYHVLALRVDGSVWAWGGNQHGQLGDGKWISHDRPERVAGLAKIRLISSSGDTSQAVGTDGKAWGWGIRPRTAVGWPIPHPIKGGAVVEGGAVSIAKDLPVKLELAVKLKKNQVDSVYQVVASVPGASIPVASAERIRAKEAPVVNTPVPRATVDADVTPPKREEPQVTIMHISGFVHLSGMTLKDQAVSGVEIAGTGAECAKTDARGEYFCSVPLGWSGRLSAIKRSYMFSPNTLSFRDVREDRSYQDFAASYGMN